MSDSIIEVKGISKQYSIGQRETSYLILSEILGNIAKKIISGKISKHNKSNFWALKNVSFEVKEGEILGIIGPNGAGKSTLLKILSRITPPTKGEIRLRGSVASLLEVGTGFHPELTGRENIFLNGAILGMTRQEIKSKLEEIVEFSGVSKFIDTPIKHYSSGMQVRLAFSVAAHLDSDILLVDEVLAVGDAEFQRKSLGKMQDISSQGRTVLFVSHNLSAIDNLCNKVILLDSGRIANIGSSEKMISTYITSRKIISSAATLPPKNKYTNGILRLRKIIACNEKGNSLGTFDITKPIFINVYYEVLKPNIWFSIQIQLRDATDLAIFQSPEDASMKPENVPKSSGVYKSVCQIPGNFLTEGLYSVRVSVVGNFDKLKDINFMNAITLYINDELRGNSVRGKTNSRLKGVVMPKLAWQRIKLTNSLNKYKFS